MNFKEFQEKFQKKKVLEYPNNGPTNPVVSICIQTYNQSKFISTCLDNILNQNVNFEYEILLGDDKSSDGTREICLKYANNFPDKIRLFLHERENNISIENKSTGLFNSFFNLLSAKGKYIAYCDGDDYWNDRFKLQKQVEFLEKNENYSICYHGIKTVDENGNEVFKEHLEQSQRDFTSEELKKVLVQPAISTWCFRNLIEEIPIEMTKTINADNFWISLIGFYGHGKFLTGINPSHYRVHKRGIWSLIRRDSQLHSKMKTYLNLSNYHFNKGNLELAIYFKKNSDKYFKMLYYYHLKHLNYHFLKLNTFRFFRIQFSAK